MKNKVIGLICCLSLLLGTIISIIDFWCFNDAFYKNEYTNLKTAESIGMSEEDLDKTTDILLNYLKDRDNTLDIEVSIKGQVREVFNEREKAHMVDVRELYFNAITVRNVAYGIFAFCIFILVYKKNLNCLYKSYLKALAIFGFIFIAIAIFCIIDFDSFWTSFHHIFFAGNDLWLLDPRTNVLIMMVPSKFFFDLCISIVFSIFVVMFIYFIIIKILDKKVINKC